MNKYNIAKSHFSTEDNWLCKIIYELYMKNVCFIVGTDRALKSHYEFVYKKITDFLYIVEFLSTLKRADYPLAHNIRLFKF